MLKKKLVLGLLIGSCSAAFAQTTPVDSLKTSFQTPPLSAKPRVWWHWMSGNVTQEGITADLEWMKRVGIGGMQMFDIGGLPKYVDKQLIWMTPEWKAALRHAASEADRLGLEMSMAASGGWSETAGPWVKPQQAMKRIAFSSTIVGAQGAVHLPRPGNLYQFDGLDRGGWPDSVFYVDTRVVAFRLPAGVTTMADAHPEVIKDSFSIEYRFKKPFTAYGLEMDAYLPDGILQYSADGKYWMTCATKLKEHVEFQKITAMNWRILRTDDTSKPRRIELLSIPRVWDWWDKAQYGGAMSHYDGAKPEFRPTPAMEGMTGVLDLTDKMQKDGTLAWHPTTGRWLVLRMGYTLTGATNHPATPEASGLEVDKLSYQHVHDYMTYYAGMVSDAVGPYWGKSFRNLLMDSWECGTENWSEDILTEFKTRRGYNPAPYLPVLAGYIVGSSDQSDRFLFDYRKTIAELVAYNHYKLASDFLKTQGMGLYAEAPGIHIQTTADGLLSKGQVSVPMGEFWANDPTAPGADPMNVADIEEAASAAHIYGKGLVAAESFTGGKGWNQAPYELKEYADWALAAGVNRFVVHTSVHQPFTDEHHKPGMTLYFFGQHYTRNSTWAEQSVVFNTYLARSSYLLQQGLNVADLAYYYGDGAPVVVPFWKNAQSVPAGYKRDWMNTDVLLNRLTFADGRLVLPDGMSYRVLVLPDWVNQISLPVARKLRDLVAAGAVIVAPKPLQTPGLSGYPQADDTLRALVQDLWADMDGQFVTEHQYGKGKVIWGKDLKTVLDSQRIAPDFISNAPGLDNHVVWIHRKAGDTDIYFVSNLTGQPVDLQTRYRVTGRAPECWQAETGAIKPAPFQMDDTTTTIPLHLDSYGSTFVVFDAATAQKELPAPAHNPSVTVAQLTGPWTIHFTPGWGAPDSVATDSLISWTVSPEPGVKYYSGTAAYTKDVNLTVVPGSRYQLNLGEVHEVVEVYVNGRNMGTRLTPSYVFDITDALKQGANHLEIRVTNLWNNRLVGDAQKGVTHKYTFTSSGRGSKAPLMISGLLGPVTITQQ